MRRNTGKSRWKPLPEHERAIGGRLAAARRFCGETQEALGRYLGISRDSIYNMESGRVPVRFLHAWHLCQYMNINPDWLHHGEHEPMRPFPKLDPDQMEIGEIEAVARQHATFFEGWAAVGWLVMGMDEQLKALRRRLLESQNYLGGALGKLEIKDSRLTNIIPKDNIKPMESEISRLIERVQAVCARQRGKRAELARHLGVEPARISVWLTGKKTPGGENALRMLRWVQEQERLLAPKPPGL